MTCPAHFVQFARKCYKFSEDEKSWSDARTACQSISDEYDLVVIDDPILAEYFVQKVDHWIGLSDLDNEGTYTWVNGNGLGFAGTPGEAPWGFGEPNVRILYKLQLFRTSSLSFYIFIVD